MKFGIRKPSIKKSFKARTTGKIKRKAKKVINPFYGKKGVGFVKNPSKSIKNSIYHKTTFGVSDLVKSSSSKKSNSKSVSSTNISSSNPKTMLNKANHIANTLNTTTNPQNFFESIDEFRAFMPRLTPFYRTGQLKGPSISSQINKFNNMLPNEINKFIERYYEKVNVKILNLKTEKSKIKELESFFQNLKYYNSYMFEKNVSLYEKLYNDAIDKYNLRLRKVNYIFCNYCGKQIKNDSIFCIFCGKKV